MGSEETKYNEIQTWTTNNNLDDVYKPCHLTLDSDNKETTTVCEDNGKILNGLPDELMHRHIQRFTTSSSSYETTIEATKMEMVSRFDAGNTLTKDSISDLYGPLQWNSVNASREDFFADVAAATNGCATVVRPSFPSERLIYQCLHCPKTFTSEKYLRMHLALHKTWLPDWDHCKNVAIVKPTVKTHGGGSGGCIGGVGGGGLAGGASQWTCNVCGKTFAQNSNYKNHIRTHSEERPFVCDICCIGFKERYHLKKHTLFKHTRELNEQCGHCGKRFKDSTAVRAHERIHSDARPYICIRCGKAFKTSECLWHHDHRSKTCGRQQTRSGPGAVKHHHQQQQHGYIAHLSDGRSRYAAKAAAVNHQFIGSGFIACKVGLDIANTKWPKTFRKNDAHGQSPLSLLTPPLIPDFQPQSLATTHSAYLTPGHQMTDLKFEINDPTDCTITSKMLVGNSQLGFEASLQSPLETGKANSSSAMKNMTCRSIISAKDGPVNQTGSYDGGGAIGGGGGGGKKRAVCMTCGKHFVSAPAFNKHMLMHSESRPYRCTICDIGFKLKVHLKKHNLYRHNSDYPCKCSVCGKRFKDSSAVRLHERIHSNERPFQCQCGKSFKTRENLWGHRHRRPCLKYTLEQGQTCQRRRKADPSRTDELQLEPKTEVTGGELTSTTLMKTLSPVAAFFGSVGGDLCSTMTDSLGAEYGFRNDRKTMNSDYQDILAPDILDIKPVIPVGLRHFQEALDPYHLEKIASNIKDADFSPSSCSSSFCSSSSSSSTAAAVAAAAMAYNLSAHDAESAYQMNNSLPPFETLISALRSCAGYSQEATLPESSQGLSLGQQAKLLDGSCFVNDRIVSDGLYAAASCGGWSSGPHVAGSRQHLPRNSDDDLPVVDLSMQQQQSSGVTYLTESFSSGTGDVGSDHSLITGDCGSMVGSMRSHHLAPIFYWDDEPWLDQRLLTPSLANTANVWHDADNLLTDLSVKSVVGLL